MDFANIFVQTLGSVQAGAPIVGPQRKRNRSTSWALSWGSRTRAAASAARQR
jgi:hypothetical protein